MDFEKAREQLITLLGHEIQDRRVLEAMAHVNREEFVPWESRIYAYDDRPLPIGFEQTISQPYIVALMTQALELKGSEKVLEIGTGSGYQTAILSHMGRQVYSTERIKSLADGAKELLARLGYTNIYIKIADEELGWAEYSPYDAIIVTAATPSIPVSLVEQLAIGGRMIIPVGSRWEQKLLKMTRGESGNKVEHLGDCRFVPLIGKDGWNG